MRCERCQSEDATIHISSILHAGTNLQELHLCQECAQVTQAEGPLLSPTPEPLPVVAARPVMSLSNEAKEKIRSVNDKLVELEPILQSFCAQRGYSLRVTSELWPSRDARADGEIHRYLRLTTDARFIDILKRGFYREMPWSLKATATPRMAPGQPLLWRVLTVDVFRALPFCELAGVLENGLQGGFLILRGLSLEDVLARGEMPQARPAFP